MQEKILLQPRPHKRPSNIFSSTSLRHAADQRQRHIWQAIHASRIRPGEKGYAGAATLEVFQLDLVIARRERHVSRVGGCPLCKPLVDFWLSVNIKTHSVVSGDREAIGTRRKVDRPRPTRREIIHAYTARCAGATKAKIEVEENGAVVAHHRWDA